MDKYRIDSHKLIYHPGRVSDWLAGRNIYPIYAEISPSGACNHRCVYCALDFMEYKPRFLDADILKKRLAEMGTLGLKSVMYAGEGEPFLHPRMAELANAAKSAGIDVSFTTNAALFKPAIADKCLKSVEWLKVSINGGTPGTYAKIHRCRPEDFEKVFDNMKYAHKLRRRKGYKVTLGMQLVLLPGNAGEVEILARRAKAAGMDYLIIKPYSQHPLSKTNRYKDIRYAQYEALNKRLQQYSSPAFSVIFRMNTMKKWDAAANTCVGAVTRHGVPQTAKHYGKCCALPFWTYIDAGGNVWGCSMFLGKKEFLYGNVMETSFRKVWESEKRKRSLRMVAEHLDASKCRINCRMDEVNSYLWDLRHPPEHVNFI